MSAFSSIYLVSQNWESGYDTFDSFVIICDSEDEARNAHPCHVIGDRWDDSSWCPLRLVNEQVVVRRIGITQKQDKEIICTSFNAG